MHRDINGVAVVESQSVMQCGLTKSTDRQCSAKFGYKETFNITYYPVICFTEGNFMRWLICWCWGCRFCHRFRGWFKLPYCQITLLPNIKILAIHIAHTIRLG